MSSMSDQDKFDAGFRDLLSPEELAALSDIALLSLLDGPDDRSARRRQLEREWNRRGSMQTPEPAKPEPDHASDKAATPKNDPVPNEPHWWKRPLGMVFLGVATPVLTALVLYLIARHFGVVL